MKPLSDGAACTHPSRFLPLRERLPMVVAAQLVARPIGGRHDTEDTFDVGGEHDLIAAVFN